MLIDSHAHLYDKKFKEDLDECINRAKQVNIEKIILVGYDDNSNKQALKLAKQNDIFEYTFGIHPNLSKDDYKKQMQFLEEILKENTPKAIGECGLDYYYFQDNQEVQKELFEFQINLGIKYDLPLIIHTRDAIEDTYNLLSKYKGKIRGVVHSYSGCYDYALKFIDLGFYISIAPPVTYKNASSLKEVAAKIPLDKIIIETDSPYLPPQAYRGKRNESAYVKYVCDEIATLRQLPYQDIANQTTINAKKVFNLS